MAICVSFLIFGWQNGAEFTVHLRESVEDVAKKCSEIKKKCGRISKKCRGIFKKCRGIFKKCGSLHTDWRPFPTGEWEKCAFPAQICTETSPVSPGCQATFRFATAAAILADRRANRKSRLSGVSSGFPLCHRHRYLHRPRDEKLFVLKRKLRMRGICIPSSVCFSC